MVADHVFQSLRFNALNTNFNILSNDQNYFSFFSTKKLFDLFITFWSRQTSPTLFKIHLCILIHVTILHTRFVGYRYSNDYKIFKKEKEDFWKT